MRGRIYQVDAFTQTSFPATVPGGPCFAIRWFTPMVEVPLCGHATLASGAVVLERLRPDLDHLVFNSPSGPLPVGRVVSGYRIDLPVRHCTPIQPPEGLADALGVQPVETMWEGANVLVRIERAADVRGLRPDLAAIGRMPAGGVIVTAAGDDGYDCVSRYFAPAKGILEDPVTGGAHCALTPFWAERLGKIELRAYQASARGGDLECRLNGDRVELTGSCVFFLEGEVEWRSGTTVSHNPAIDARDGRSLPPSARRSTSFGT